MKFVRITEALILNLDAVASVNAGTEESGKFVAVVRYLAPAVKSDEAGLCFERFEGEEAEAVYEFFTQSLLCTSLRTVGIE